MDFISIKEFFEKNPFFAGGAALGAAGGLLAYLRNVPNILFSNFLRIFSIECEIRDDDDIFQHFEQFFAKRKPPRFTRIFRVQYEQDKTAENKTLSFSLGSGKHYFFHKGILLSCIRHKLTEKADGSDRIKEQFYLRVYTRNLNAVKDFFEDIRIAADPEYSNIKLYQLGKYGDNWTYVKSLKKKDENNIVLQPNVFSTLKSEIEAFYSDETRDFYERRNVPYRRGYLFYGPPGNGKTSTIMNLASILSIPIYMVTDLSGDMTDMAEAFHTLPQKCFVVFEDIDSLLIGKKNKRNEQGSAKFNMSNFLNLIDGLCSAESQILFMTTNHPDELEDSLVRPGRIDRRVEFTNPCKQQLEGIYKKFIEDSDLSTDFATKALELNKSCSFWQEFFLQNSTEEQAFKQLESLC